MILPMKALAAAGLVASLATGGAVVRAQSDDRPVAASAGATVTTGAAPATDDAAPAGVDTRPDAKPETTTTTAPPPAAAPAVTPESAGDAGTIDLSTVNGFLTIAAIHPDAGWTVAFQKAAGHEVRVLFRNGLRRIEFKAELEDGRLAVRVEDHTVEAEPAEPAVAPQPDNDADDDHDGIEQEQEQEVEQEHSPAVVTPAPSTAQVDDDHSGSGRDGDGDHSGRDGGEQHSGGAHGDVDHPQRGRSGCAPRPPNGAPCSATSPTASPPRRPAPAPA